MPIGSGFLGFRSRRRQRHGDGQEKDWKPTTEEPFPIDCSGRLQHCDCEKPRLITGTSSGSRNEGEKISMGMDEWMDGGIYPLHNQWVDSTVVVVVGY